MYSDMIWKGFRKSMHIEGEQQCGDGGRLNVVGSAHNKRGFRVSYDTRLIVFYRANIQFFLHK